MLNLMPRWFRDVIQTLFPFAPLGFAIGKGDDGGGGGFVDPQQFGFLDPAQTAEIVGDLRRFQDFPDRPLGTRGREVLQERLGPDFIPYAFQPSVLNPFVQAQFRLGREQTDRDVSNLEAQAQRLGGFFSPDLPQFSQRIRERQNLNEQDYLSRLLFQGGTLRESLVSDALAKAFGLEKTTGGVLDQILGRNLQQQQLGIQAQGLDQGSGGGGFGIGDLFSSLIGDSFLGGAGGDGGLGIIGDILGLSQTGGDTGGGGGGPLDFLNQIFPELLGQQQSQQTGLAPSSSGFFGGGQQGGGGQGQQQDNGGIDIGQIVQLATLIAQMFV